MTGDWSLLRPDAAPSRRQQPRRAPVEFTSMCGLQLRQHPPPKRSPELSGRRKLRPLEVSSVGLGVQNMSRNYETTVPSRPEMINIIRAAYDHGVTFFDTAEAYGPLECERILGTASHPSATRS